MLPGMAVFISVTTSAFSLDARRQPYTGVRRPMRGLQIKEDTYAIIRVLTATGEELTLLDGGADSTESEDGIGRSSRYSNFLIQALQDQRAEKRQIIETFGEDYVFFFGETPRFLNVSGVLLNTADFNWRNEWWENYERHLRGTRLVEQNARLYLYFDDVVVEGYIVSSSTDNQATSKELVPFTFLLFVTNYACIGAVGSIRFQSEEQAVGVPPVGNSAQTQDSVSRAGGLAGVLAQAARFQNDASFSVQNTLENIKIAERQGTAIDVKQGAGELGLILAAKILASKAASVVQRATGQSGSSIIVHGAVAKGAEAVASKIPTARAQDMAILLMNDPAALANVLKKETTDAGRRLQIDRFYAWAIQSGVASTREDDLLSTIEPSTEPEMFSQ